MRNPVSPKWLSIEGIDGTGKSTLCKELQAHLATRGVESIVLADPGDTPTGAELRRLLLHTDLPMTWITEAMLFNAARAQLVYEKVVPALESGKWVIQDRGPLTTIAYQACSHEPSEPERQKRVHVLTELAKAAAAAHKGHQLDASMLLVCKVGTARSRISEKNPDRFESRSDEFFQNVSDTFRHLEVWRQLARGSVVNEVWQIDAEPSLSSVFNELKARVAKWVD